MDREAYKPIEDYGVIGNLRTAALVGRDGSIDWCCFPNLDHPSVFGAILDIGRGGRFRVRPVAGSYGEQRYLDETNVLETSFWVEGGRLTVTDFMPLWGDIGTNGGSDSSPEIYRVLHAEGTDIEAKVEWSPRFNYARARMNIERIRGGWIALDGDSRMTLGGVRDAHVEDDGYGPVLRARVTVRAGRWKVLVSRWATEDTEHSLDDAMALLDQTAEIWRNWVHKRERGTLRPLAGKWVDQLIRSSLVLKLLTHADTGAIAAAATTSLPETIGGVRNWDYRYTWIRDASLTAQALISLGHEREAFEFLHWVKRVTRFRSGMEGGIQIMYSLHGETDLTEEILSHLEGYRRSSPVRIGNAAAGQLQLDIFGEVLNAGYELVRHGYELEPSHMLLLKAVADQACLVWQKPDHGIWEIRDESRHYVHSKLMIWVALNRAVQLSEEYGLPGRVDIWRKTRSILRKQIIDHGYNADLGCFVQSFGSRALDASNLRIPLHEFLLFDDPRVQGTINRTIEQLSENGLVYRYRADDNLPGTEGGFGLCTFWLVDALALSGRVDEAWRFFEAAACRANHLGLFAEQFDPTNGESLGNFPQAFTHLGLINSLLYLAHAEGKKIPEPPPMYPHESRVESLPEERFH